MRILGGVREAFFSDNYYKLLWGKRVGFAKIALEAQVVRKSSGTLKASQAISSKYWKKSKNKLCYSNVENIHQLF